MNSSHLEIERKFLVRDTSALNGVPGIEYRQGYLSTDPGRVVRVREAGGYAYITIKGTGEGPTRPEFEYEIPRVDARPLLALCKRPLVEKTRYRLEHAGLVWEVDVFTGANAGLVLAEVELPSADTRVDLPPWAGEEVTDDPRYQNASLVARPFREWGDTDPQRRGGVSAARARDSGRVVNDAGPCGGRRPGGAWPQKNAHGPGGAEAEKG